jgi:pyruvate/2-oxoglutarate/acetoin dehydrogenase E1 component/TPP-dependent pyruvate/acetoin dehydrogenase alpha subunit
MSEAIHQVKKGISKEEFKSEILTDYKIAFQSRQASLVGRKEVLTGKAKFGIFGDGKELAQVVLAKFFKKGDFRSGYYRDQTFMFAKGMSSVQEFFAQLYAHVDVNSEPSSGGRSMNGHFGTRLLDSDGNWICQTDSYNSSSDISPTAGQMSRLVGLAWASKIYRNNPSIDSKEFFSKKGNEVAFGTIGNASTSEGPFWEAINAAGVLQIPMVVSIWDDEYGISVPAKYQTTKENLSSILSGFQSDDNGVGYEIYKVSGWDYPALVKTYQEAVEKTRKTHVPALIHVTQLTQPQGHSTSGSHERYKSEERLKWEEEYDCLKQFRKWIESKKIASKKELDAIEAEAVDFVRLKQKAAWSAYLEPIELDVQNALTHLQALNEVCDEHLDSIIESLKRNKVPIRKDVVVAIHQALRLTIGDSSDQRSALVNFDINFSKKNKDRYSSHLYSESKEGTNQVELVAPEYSDKSPTLNGYEVLQNCFSSILERDARVVAFGEDLGQIGDVNQGFAGLQEKFGEARVMDVGIRENTIIGQAIGASLRGLRPIAEIQYLDYLIYALQVMSDDIATLQYRTKGGQKAPVIIRTRGHRLEGIWHSGSPMGMIIHAVRGIHVLVPRNMVQAAGFYNTLLKCDEPGLVVECLNGYRLKEVLPDNLDTFTLPMGIPEILVAGHDVTLVSYGSTLRIARDAMDYLSEVGISVELIDVQTLLPFDLNGIIAESVKKTNKVVFLDEDVPGGATSYMMQQVLEKQRAYQYLDAEPRTISSRAHRPAYGTDGDYFSKPNAEDIFQVVYNLMNEYDPISYPSYN